MKRVALIIGHTPLVVGAVNPTANETEFDFNNKFVPRVAKQLPTAGYQPVVRTEPSNDVNLVVKDVIFVIRCYSE